MTGPSPNRHQPPEYPGDADWDAAYEELPGNGHTNNGAGNGRAGAHAMPPAAPAPRPPGDTNADTNADAEVDAGAEAKSEAAPVPRFSSLEEWVTKWLAPMTRVEVGSGMRWCAEWWRHPLAILVLESLWRTWEDARISKDPTAMSVWLHEHAYPHLDFLMEGTRSPFRQCSGYRGGHRDELKPLPIEPAPPGTFAHASAG